MKKLPLDPNSELFKWGPVPLRYFYQSDFNITLGMGYFNKIYPSYIWPKSLALYKDNKILWLTEFSPLRIEAGKAFREIFLTDKWKEIYVEYDRALKDLEKIERKINKLALSKLALAEFVSLWMELHETVIIFFVHGLIPEFCNVGSDKVLENELEKHIHIKTDLNAAMEVLTAPEEQSFYQEEEIDLAETDDIKDHVKKYFWLNNGYSSVSVLDDKFFLKRKKEINPNIRKEVESRFLKVKKLKEDLREKFKLSDGVMEIALGVTRGIVWQDQRKKSILQYLHYKEMLLGEVVSRTSIGKDDILNFSYIDISKILGGENYKDQMLKRRNGFGEVITDRIEHLNSRLTKEYFEIFSKEKIDKTVSEIRGVVASRGIVSGPVRIVLDPHDISHMLKGDVLVTTMTSPEFIFAMRMSSAIVTDSGGLTSHAAIVSRELEKPCIIGTKIATQVLKDGDMVEVDADRGIIKILK